jgi:predicted component of viral defense system (DUF524 family)
MPELLKISSKDWTLTVWSKDVDKPRKRLQKTLAARQGSIPAEIVRARDAAVDYCVPEGPVFFENQPYEFEFEFKDGVKIDPEPEIIHRLRAVTDAFHFKHKKYLTGTINFGNDVGWFRLTARYRTVAGLVDWPISLLVLPTKMDLGTDLEVILSAVDRQYPLWRFSLSGKTEQELAESRKPHERFPLLWLAQFTELRSQLEEAVKRILESPHARLLESERRIKADRLKGRIPVRIEQALAEDHFVHNYDRRYRIIEKRLSTDTPENRFIKMVLVQCHKTMSRLHARASGMNVAPENQLLSDTFIEQLGKWSVSLDRLRSRPFFREIGPYTDNGHESLVLHNRLGYSRVYRIWQKLKLYLDVLGNGAAISLKSMDELYEVWCFLAIKDMLVDDLGFTETHSSMAKLRNGFYEKQLIDGRQAAFEFISAAGVCLRLSHEPQFTRNGGNDGLASFTTSQKPDIFLEADFPDGTSLSWVFDAKYRIAEDADELDKVPEDAINQMHRYRDALIYRQGNSAGYWSKSRSVFGAFALYPGAVDEQSANNRYNDWISDVGIGAFPLLPGSPNGWLREFLRTRLQYSGNKVADAAMFTDRLYAESPARIPVRGMRQVRHEGLTALIKTGSRRSRVPDYYQALEGGRAKWMHIRMKAIGQEERNALDEMRYAVPCYELPNGTLRGEWCYPVLSAEVVKRDRISAIQSGSREHNPANTRDYLLIELGASFHLDVPADGNFAPSEFFKLTIAEDLRILSGRPVIDRRYAFFGDE